MVKGKKGKGKGSKRKSKSKQVEMSSSEEENKPLYISSDGSNVSNGKCLYMEMIFLL
jgi:hypothetical protein